MSKDLSYTLDMIRHYPRPEQVAIRWGKHTLARIFLDAVENEDYELCKEIKQTFKEYGFDETYSKETLIREFKDWYGKNLSDKMTDERLREVVDVDFGICIIEAKDFLGINY